MANERTRSRAPQSSADAPSQREAFRVGETTLDLEDVSDEELESLYFEDDVEEDSSFLNLQTLSGLSLILAGIIYLLSELEVWAAPPTARDAANVERRAKGSSSRMALFTVIYLAKDAEGRRLFQDDAATVAALENEVSAEVIAELAAKIMAVSEVADLGN